MPYRSEKRRAAERPAPEPGLVTEMVRQFADPYAFLRELVQNSIDAGGSSIAARVERASDGLVSTSVRDDGSGMTPEVIEGALLTLFSSTKEGDTSKVGKYGVGFMSVFAIEPERVIVETWREGSAHELTLSPDHSYVLSELEGRDAHGTCVTLVHTMAPADFERHVVHCKNALERWCGHAVVPIRLAWLDESSPASTGSVSIDRPLDLEAPVQIRAAVAGGEVVVGCAPPGAPGRTCAGFYNRGLTLHVETEPLPGLSGVRFKLNSTELAHTLSRDNVRRDGVFDRLLDEVRVLVGGELRERAAAALCDAAETALPEAYGRLLATARAAPLSLDKSLLSFRLADAVNGEKVLNGDVISRLTPMRSPVLWARAPSALTAALARERRPVLLCESSEIVRVVGEVFDLRSLFGAWGFRAADELWVLLEEVSSKQLGASASRFGDALAAVLAASGNRVGGVGFAAFRGARLERCAVLLDDGDSPLQRAEDLAAPRRTARSRRLVLDARSEPVIAARARARKDLASAVQLFARFVLVELEGALGASENSALLAAFEGNPA
jgi:hypothetical protein